MGTIIDESQFPGKCPECEQTFKKNAKIYYQKDPKIACPDEACAIEQGWIKTAYSKSSSGKGTGSAKITDKFWNREELDAIIPNVEPLIRLGEEYMKYLKTADNLATEIYPELKSVDKNTFGQIRSRITQDLIALDNK